jgi:hypothetical protein
MKGGARGSQRERDHYQDQNRDGWIILALCGLHLSGSGQGQVETSCECGNEPSGYIKCWETIEWIHNW